MSSPVKPDASNTTASCGGSAPSGSPPAPLTDGVVEPLQMIIDAHAALPPWSVGTITGQDFGHLHFEQAVRLEGSITVAGERIPIASMGFRDHSRGPRDHSKLAREGWSFGFTPSGKAYFGVRIWQDDGPGFTAGMVFDGDTVHDVTAMQVRCSEPGAV